MTFYCFECGLDTGSPTCPSCGGLCVEVFQCKECDWQLESEKARCPHCGGFFNDEAERVYFSEGREYTERELMLNETFGY